VGELALGNLRQREVVLSALSDLPSANIAADAEVLDFIGRQSLFGLGIGYVDAHLLAAARLTPGAELWTHDRQLRDVATRLGLAFSSQRLRG
jgi:predicted nucleic acid-binding protein